jgi:nucleotide-binding universal stress UspA family protein
LAKELAASRGECPIAGRGGAGTMVEIRKILCPTDLSPHAGRALGMAVTLARWHRSEITVVTVLPPGPPSPGAPSASPTAGGEPDLAETMDRFVEPATASGIPVRMVVQAGNVVEEILREGRSWHADLIVLGTHGQGGFQRWALGSVSDKTLRLAHCPVLTVPCRAGIEDRHGAGDLKTILCPVDFSESSGACLEYALSLAREADARLILAHVVEGLPDHEPSVNLHFNVAEYRLYLARAARERLGRILPDEARAWCEPEETVAMGKAYREILRLARDHGADLIVMGSHGWGALDPMLLGSTAHHVAREAGCSVLTVRGSIV